MLARRLPTILPSLRRDHALEVASVRSIAGLFGPTETLDRRPPLRSPHHSMSAAALLGGGAGVARPGELSLAQANDVWTARWGLIAKPLLWLHASHLILRHHGADGGDDRDAVRSSGPPGGR
ncbi:MAG TPA: ATP-binding protein [Egibacteraceae bacterium]|nr:ATP-binding protein [Egibacteraceae bacterium]